MESLEIKLKYEEPELLITLFHSPDIITTSVTEDDDPLGGDDGPLGGDDGGGAGWTQ